LLFFLTRTLIVSLLSVFGRFWSLKVEREARKRVDESFLRFLVRTVDPGYAEVEKTKK